MKGTRKILFSVVALVITLAMAATSTYAWFTVNQGATVDTINVDVKTGQNLYVRMLGEADSQYTNLLPLDRVIAAMNSVDDNTKSGLTAEEFAKVKLDALTTADGKTYYYGDAVINDKMTPSGDQPTANEIVTATSKQGSYISFTVKFRTDVKGYVVLDKGTLLESDVTNATSEITTNGTWLADTVYDYGAGSGSAIAANTKIDAKVANAARVSFISENITRVFDQNIGAKAAAGGNLQVAYYKAVYGFDTFDIVDQSTEKAGLTPNTITTPSTTAAYKVTPVAEKKAAENGAVTVENIVAELKAEDGNTGFYTAEVKINIWIDGNDSECLNAIFNQTLKTTLAFGYWAGPAA